MSIAEAGSVRSDSVCVAVGCARPGPPKSPPVASFAVTRIHFLNIQYLLLILEDLFPGASTNLRKRLCSYRSMVFWCWPDIRRGERRPLPSCLVHMIRATFPPTEDEEQYAEWQFKGFCYADEPQ